MTLVSLLQVMVALSGNPPAVARPSPQVVLRDAVQLFESFKDERAAAALRALLSQSPPASIAATAHIYLALIALNAGDAEAAKGEFAKAVRTDVLVELPPDQSPKARFAFGQVRSDLVNSVEGGLRSSVRPAAEAVPAVPTPFTAAPEAAVTESEPKGHIRAGAWWLGGAGLAVGIVGTVLFGLAEATLGGDKTAALSDGGVAHSLTPSTYFGATTEGNVGEALWAVGGALLVGGGIVALTGGSR